MGDQRTWHLCWQAAYGHSFLARPALAAWIRERLIESHARRERVLVAFVMLPCEVHTLSRLAEPDGPESVSREVGSVLSRRMRRESGIAGHPLRGKYLAHWLESEAELRADVRMLAWRPVVAGLCRSPSHHVHGAYRAALGISSPEGFNVRPLLEAFGAAVPQGRAALRQCTARRPTPEQWAWWELTRGLAGPGACMERAPWHVDMVRSPRAARLIAAGGGTVDGALSLLESWVRRQLVDGAAGADAARTMRTAVRVRALLACLAVDHGVCSAAEFARRCGRAKSTLSEHMALCRRRPGEALLLETPLDQILADVLGGAALRRLP